MSEKSRVPALSRCMDILAYLEKNRQCTVSDLILDLNLPKSSSYVLVDEMIKQGLIHQDKHGNLQLWLRLIELGSATSKHIDIRDKVIEPLNQLLESFECLAVHYGIMDGLKAYYLIKLESPNAPMLIKSREGLPISLVHAGLGKCLLAFQKEAVREKILPSLDYTPVSKTSITSADKLRKELSLIRKQGWAFDNSEGEADIRCVACPVFNSREEIIGAISIVGMVAKFNEEIIPKVVKRTQACAKEIEVSLRDFTK